jgi:hypothetical protein
MRIRDRSVGIGDRSDGITWVPDVGRRYRWRGYRRSVRRYHVGTQDRSDGIGGGGIGDRSDGITWIPDVGQTVSLAGT